MFTVKNDPSRDAYRVIAGEMLNREASLKHFVDGVARETMPKDYVGYPSYETEGRRYSVKASSGYIYIPTDINIGKFIVVIDNIITEMEKDMVRLDGKDIKHLNDHQTYECGFSTNVRRPHTGVNAARFIGVSGASAPKVRFVWKVEHINNIDLSVTSDNINDAISRLCAGIFWDSDDILTLEHGSSAFKFDKNVFKANANVVPEKVTLINADNPLLIELNEYWKESLPTTVAADFLRDVNEKKLYSADMSIIDIKPVKISDDSSVLSTEICSRCKNPLYGDIYGLYGSVTKPEDSFEADGKLRVTAICPMCLHSGPEDAPIEQKYFRVLRIKFGRSAEDMIDMQGGSEDLVNIRREALKGVVKCVVKGAVDSVCYLIGDKYVGFEHIRNYRYTYLVNDPKLQGRKVCKVVMVA